MDLHYSAEDEAYRRRAREWLKANIHHARLPKDRSKIVESRKEWQRLLHEAGYVGLAWPKKYGGQEATITEQVVLNEELAGAGAPPLINNVGLTILGPTLIHHGSEEQKERYLLKILTAEELWCQGFSEPEAGSDLASLRMKAEERGDFFLLNGQKVWTTLGPIADWCFLLARTDTAAPKREGISYLLVNMKTPGITIRPLKNIAGREHFSEVFFENVEVPKENLVGEKNGGWAIAKASLVHERTGLAQVVALQAHLRRLLDLAGRMEREGRPVIAEEKTRSDLAQMWIEIEAIRHLGYRTLTAQLEGKTPGAFTSVSKLFSSEMRQRMMQAALRMEGPLAQVMKRSPHTVDKAAWQMQYLDSRAYTIGAGTSEVMRNIIAERILGLPKSYED